MRRFYHADGTVRTGARASVGNVLKALVVNSNHRCRVDRLH